MRLSLLDRSRTRMGRPEAEGLTGSIERAEQAERLGYERFWVAEHHAVPGIASGSPPVLLAAIGARTSTIRLGSGGVMLPNHQPLVVAEQFLMLEALYPGRVDLGVGRSVGFTAPVREALRADLDATDTFEADVDELRDLLHGDAAVTAHPVAEAPVPMSLLATGRGLEIAARLGLPVVVGGPVLWTADGAEAIAAYRRGFRPSELVPEPYVTVSLDVFVADDDASARELALPEAWAMARSRQTGEFPPLEPVSSIRAQPWSSQLTKRVETSLDRAVAGSPATVARRLDDLAERTGADELMASTSTFDRGGLVASDRALRQIVT
ncbi:LLM class flavin-dependent oxidoreductase [Aeromicrobium endophyticum]|uniref:LLM class flavin-dependent oxidoreductase n=1 Tax=Aeromicrobium endophyticum TaxID=2292704 RepID=A0A371PAE8_9ACTN|nr:LLM class flavin-dependent oxidoreductase [Aeromicrobium endophyticum]REK72923.1 LLM class flavin-dependent oxidoreductase [Aeromicrobium endophyticum]